MPIPLPEILRQMPVPPPGPVVVAMSGGVDSSVTAALLKAWGYEIQGVMLKLWTEPGREHQNRCCTLGAQILARQVAKKLAIPFTVLDVREAFYRSVVQYFLEGHRQGITPNPCLVCNREIRWGLLWAYAQRQGARALATGHYARILRTPEGPALLRGIDPVKDQSYVLSRLSQDQLNHTLLPLGFLTKAEVRQWAKRWGLPVARQHESQDLCFLGQEDYRAFLRRHAPETLRPGPILNLRGEVLGTHQGLALYTLGQRRGLGIARGAPLYVVHKDPEHQALIVGSQRDRYRQHLVAREAHWLTPLPPRAPFWAEVQIRYTAPAQPALVVPGTKATFAVHFQKPVADPTPGQVAVVYQGERCIGSGIIEAAPPPG